MKCALEIRKAVSTVQKSLLAGIPSSSQSLVAAEVTLLRQCFRDFVGLIKPSPPFASPMQRHRNNNPGRIFLNRETRIVPKLFHEQCEFAVEMDLSAVLVGVHDLVGWALSACNRTRKVEKIIHPSAMVAHHIFWDEPLDIIAALHAVGLFDPWKVFTA